MQPVEGTAYLMAAILLLYTMNKIAIYVCLSHVVRSHDTSTHGSHGVRRAYGATTVAALIKTVASHRIA